MAVLDSLIARHGHVVLVPMHMGEDPALCRQLRAESRHPDAVHVLDSDGLSPTEFAAVLSKARLVVAFRLHAGIVASSVGVPTVTYFYVDKGRLFTEQLGTSAYTRPIERMLDADLLVDFVQMETNVLSDHMTQKSAQERLADMREDVHRAFRAAVTS